jgi:hypothetical protein
MALTKQELIDMLQNEVRILVHLAGKVDDKALNYRPTEKQRSTLELLRYLTIMGPNLVRGIKAGSFDMEAWGKAETHSKTLDLKGAIAAIEQESADYANVLGGMSEADFAATMDMFGTVKSKGSHIVYLVAGGHAAYRTQLFCYLKSTGHDGLNTMNLWGGMDAPMQATS